MRVEVGRGRLGAHRDLQACWKLLHGEDLGESITCAENTAGINNCHLSKQTTWRKERSFTVAFEQRESVHNDLGFLERGASQSPFLLG